MNPKNLTRLAVLTLALSLATGCTQETPNPANSQTETPASNSEVSLDNDRSEVFYNQDGIAIKGTDPVAYFTQDKAIAGQPEFSHQWGNSTWYFASAEHRDLFASDPQKYAPEYGGFCAWAVSQNSTAPIDPEAWKIVNDKLYLNYNRSIQEKWAKDIPGNIAKADRNWPEILRGL